MIRVFIINKFKYLILMTHFKMYGGMILVYHNMILYDTYILYGRSFMIHGMISSFFHRLQ